MDETHKLVKGQYTVKKKKSDLEKRLTLEEMECLLQSINFATHKSYWRRNRAIAEMLLNTGLRVGELAGLRVYDVLAVGNKVKTVLDVRPEIAKRKKARQIPLNGAARYAIKVLLGIDQASDPDVVAYNYGLEPGFTYSIEASYTDALVRKPSGKPLSKRAIQDVITLAALKAGIDRLVGCHALRHTCLSMLYENTLNIKAVQKIAGHANSVLTANFYVHPTMDGLADAMRTIDRPKKNAAGE